MAGSDSSYVDLLTIDTNAKVTIKGSAAAASGLYRSYGGSKIYDDGNLKFATDDAMYWSAAGLGVLYMNQYGLSIQRGGLYFYTDGDSTHRWRIFTDNTGEGSGFNQGLGNLNFQTFMPDGSIMIAGFIEDDVNFTTKMNFTGSHRCVAERGQLKSPAQIQDALGLIVIASGRYSSLLGTTPKTAQKDNITISESVPTIELCTKRRDKRVFGVVAGEERTEVIKGTAKRARVFKSGTFGSYLEHDGVDRVEINSLGEGAVWVCARGGNFENGDYIPTSDLAGYGERQEEPYVCGWTLGKITCDMDWSRHNLDKDFQTRRVDGALCALVGCIYLL